MLRGAIVSGLTVLAVLVAAGGCDMAMANEFTDKLQRDFALTAGGEVSVRHVAGKVTVRGTEDAKVVLTAVKRVEAATEEEGKRELAKVTLDLEAKKSKLELVTRYGEVSVWERLKKLFTSGSKASVLVDLELAIPQGGRLQLKTVSGEVTVENVRGGVDLHAVSGAMKLSGLRGETELDTVSGDLEVTDVQGELDVETVSGDLDVKKLSGKAEVETVSGAVALRLVAGGYQGARVKTVSGNVQLELPAGTNANVEFKSVSGKSELPAGATVEKKGWKLGAGGPLLRVNTVSGGLKVTTGE